MSTEPEHDDQLDVTQPVFTGVYESDDARDAYGGGSGDGPDDDTPIAIAPRRRRVGVLTTALAFALVAGVAFYAGVLVQKHQKSSSSTSSAATALAALRNGARGGGAAGTSGAGGAGAGGGRGAVVGQVKLIDGSNIYVTDAQGNTVKVATNAGSQFSKSDTGSLADVKIGDTVVVQGPQGADGTYQAQRVSVGGAAGTGRFGGGFGGGGFGGAAG
ncbi:MAG TPA: hypothetical protein VFW74_09080 [Acidimicrobiia bacterium]|nr:hypothetical protein [Acidimicrobiia bacterium]